MPVQRPPYLQGVSSAPNAFDEQLLMSSNATPFKNIPSMYPSVLSMPVAPPIAPIPSVAPAIPLAHLPTNTLPFAALGGALAPRSRQLGRLLPDKRVYCGATLCEADAERAYVHRFTNVAYAAR